jgi:leader peptidase (prepilin peptidase)/N-methyltransferase
MTVTAVVVVVAGVVGLVVGSFLNVVIHRVPRRESVVRPRSRCPGCGAQLAGRDNVPVVSWVLLRGRCRHCAQPISPRYPAVELVTAVLWVAVAARLGADAALPAFLVFTAAMVAVAVIDVEHLIVPNRVVAGTLVLCLPLLLAAAVASGDWHRLRDGLLGGIGMAAFLLAMNLVNPRWMGMGDVKLALVLGLLTGWLGPAYVFLATFLGFLLGAVGGVLLIATGKRGRKDHVPFAPFLAGGAVVAVLVGQPILDWYRG